MSSGDEEEPVELDVEVEELEAEELEIFREPDPDEGEDEPTRVTAREALGEAPASAEDVTTGEPRARDDDRDPEQRDGAEPECEAEGTEDAEPEEELDPEADLFDEADDAELLGDAPEPAPPSSPASRAPTAAVPRGGPLPDAEGSADVEAPVRPLRVIAVGGARGGVGKSVFAANLSLYLATIGRRVVLVDADPAGANLHTCLGTAAPPPLNKLRKGAAPAEGLTTTPFRGLQLLHLGLDEPGGGAARGDRLSRLMGRLRELEAEYVVVDQGVGLGKDLLDNYLAADLSCFVTVPEPTAIENTYRFLRGAFTRFLLKDMLEGDDRAELERRLRTLGGAPPPLDLLRELEREQHPLAVEVRGAIERFRPRLVINQTRLRADLQLGFSMQSAIRRRLGLTVDYMGHIDHDDTVWTCVRNRRPLLLEVPGAKSSRKIEKLARRLLMVEAGKAPDPTPAGVPQESHHDLLEIERGATDEEVRRAYKRCREVYAHDALCCYGLLEPHEVEKVRARIDEAFDVLLDPARRRPYELSVFPEEPEPTPEPIDVDEEPLRPAPAVSPDTQFTGSLLRQVREARRVSLRDISQRTKISVAYLKALEEDDFGKLPAVVYTTGFLTEYARFLELEPKQVSRTYVGRFKRYIDEKERAFARKA
ncbi:MAG: helix-turn-helix domain-containing protein [Myxococcales bacterium]|nr:helix-turn-helix domain-containing protein [Myxococcales bacterium]